MQRSNRASRRLAIAVLAALAGCGQSPAGTAPAATPPGPRLCSLSPAVSRTCMDLGLAGRIVGRSDYCSFLDDRIPAVGNLFEVDFERLIRLRPTHVLVQPPAGGVDPALLELARRRGFTVGAWHLDSIDEIKAMIGDLPGTVYPPGQERDELADRAAELIGRIDAALAPDPDVFTGRALVLAGVDPVLAAGRGTYPDDILTALGGTNAVEQAGWVELSLEDVIRLAPEALVITSPGAAPDAPDLGPLDRASIRESIGGRIAVLAHPDAHYPSSAVVEVAAAMRRALHELERPP